MPWIHRASSAVSSRGAIGTRDPRAPEPLVVVRLRELILAGNRKRRQRVRDAGTYRSQRARGKTRPMSGLLCVADRRVMPGRSRVAILVTKHCLETDDDRWRAALISGPLGQAICCKCCRQRKAHRDLICSVSARTIRPLGRIEGGGRQRPCPIGGCRCGRTPRYGIDTCALIIST